MKKEIWKDVEEYEKYYQVSNLGNVRRKERDIIYYRNGKEIHNIKKECLLKLIDNKNGYYRVQFTKNKTQHLKLVHRLVAIAFIPNPQNYQQVNHLDGNKKNNRVDNLEWCSCKQNMEHAWKNNLYNSSKPILQIENGKIIKEYKRIKDIEREHGYNIYIIKKNLLHKTDSAYGFQWEYKKKGI